MYVTAVGPGAHAQTVKALGADRTINYLTTDFTQDGERYDFVFDTVGKSTFGLCRPLLTPHGCYISSELGPNAQNPLLALTTPWLGGQYVKFPVPVNIKASLAGVCELAEAGQYRPLIDRRYSLEQVREAYTYVDCGRKVGNVLLVMI